jgi:hypothetical protein
MKKTYITMLTVVFVSLLASPCLAGENDGAKLLVHVGATATKSACSLVPSDCRDASVTGTVGSAYNLYVCIGDHSDSVGIAGVQFGITYNDVAGQGIDIFSWTLCGDLEFSMPAPVWYMNLGGNIVTWNNDVNCKMGPAVTPAGFFYVGVYSPDRLSLIPRPVDGRAKVADCSAAEEDLTDLSPSRLGYADFGTGQGYNPCQTIVPVSETTWSGVKSLFR